MTIERLNQYPATLDAQIPYHEPAAGRDRRTSLMQVRDALAESLQSIADEAGARAQEAQEFAASAASAAAAVDALYVDTVAALRALPAPSKKCVVNLAGYYAAGDGGGSTLLWVPASTKADNGCTVFRPDSAPSNGRWERWADSASIAWAGGFSNAGSLQALLDAGVREVVIPPGTLTVTTPPQFKFPGQVIAGYSVSASTLRIQTGAGGGLLCDGFNGCGVRDLKVSGSGLTAGELLTVKSCSGFNGARVRLENGYNAANFQSINSATFENFVVADCTGAYAIRFAGVDGAKSDILKLLDGQISHSSNATITGILWESYAHSMTVDNVRCIRGGIGLRAWNSSGVASGASYPSFLQMANSEFDFSGISNVQLDCIRDAWISDLYAHGAGSGSGVTIGADAQSVRMVAPRVTSPWQHGIYIAGKDVQVIGARVWKSGQAASNTWDGIHVTATAVDVEIIGGQSGTDNAGAAATQRYGLYIDPAATRVTHAELNTRTGNVSGGVKEAEDRAYRVGGTFRHSFYSDAGMHLQIGGGAASVANRIRITGQVAGTSPILLAEGSDSNIGFTLTGKGSGYTSFGNGNGTHALIGGSVAAAVNYVRLAGQAAGSGPQILAEGADTDIDVQLMPKGSGKVVHSANLSFTQALDARFIHNTTFRFIFQNDGGIHLQVGGATASIANYFRASGQASGSAPLLLAEGTDTDIYAAIRGKGSRGVRLEDGGSTARVLVNTTGVGFNGTAPIAKPSITGSRGGNAALAALLTQLAAYGLITDSTTA